MLLVLLRHALVVCADSYSHPCNEAFHNSAHAYLLRAALSILTLLRRPSMASSKLYVTYSVTAHRCS